MAKEAMKKSQMTAKQRAGAALLGRMETDGGDKKMPFSDIEVGVSTGSTVKFHCELLRNERERRARNDEQRRQCEDYVDGLTPKDDRNSLEAWLAGVRVNNLKPDVDLMVAELAKRRLYPKIFATAGDSDNMMFKVAKMRDFQVKGLFTASDFHNHRAAAADSAARSGDGWVKFGVRPGPGGMAKVFADYTRWENLFYDSQYSKQNGDIDSGRFCAHVSLVEWQGFRNAFQHLDATTMTKIEQMARRQPMWSQSALDEYNGIDEAELYLRDAPVIGIGDSGERNFVIYGQMFFRDYATMEMWMYPFATDRGLTEIIPLAPPSQPYSHHLFPFCRWVSGVYSRSGMAYSPHMINKIGIERVKQYMLRVMVSKVASSLIFFGPDAIPRGEDNTKLYNISQYENIINNVLRQPGGGALYAENIAAIQKIDLNPEALQIAQIVQVLTGIQMSSGGGAHTALKGGGGGEHSGVALREHLDNYIASNRMIMETDRMAHEKAGRMCLSIIDDFGTDQLPMNSFLNEDGTSEHISEYPMLMKDVRNLPGAMIAAGHMGVNCRAVERSPDNMEMTRKLLIESAKGLSGSPRLLAAISAMTVADSGVVGSAAVKQFFRVMIDEGVPIADEHLTPELQEYQKKKQAMAEEQQQRDGQVRDKMTDLQLAEATAKIGKIESETDLNEAKGAKTAVEAGVAVSPQMAEKASLPKDAEGQGGLAQMAAKAEQAEALAEENAKLKQKLQQIVEALSPQGGGAGGGMV